MTEYKMQLLCLCLLLFIGVYHLRCKRLQTTAVKLFDRIISVAIINIVFDIITVHTVNHLDQVPAGLNRFVHQIFIGSMNLYIFLVCIYIIQGIRDYKNFTRRLKLSLTAPLIFAWIIIAFGPISYNTSGRIAYSYGWVPTTCYILVVVYIGISLYYCFRYWKQIDIQKKNAMLPALFIMALVAVIQKLYPESLISAMAVILMVFSIFISLENPSDYIDKKSGVYNVEGFS
ncbi:MAG: hypothetical protein PUC65_17250, partial [Clostridiales bacterium]|nr:hypothetical protein [Clostridiales bacterium]